MFIEGLKELGLGSDPSKTTITLSAGGTTAKQKQIEEYKQQVLQKALGCTVKIDYMDWGVYQTNIVKGKYQVASLAWTADYNDPMTEFDIWTTTSGMNFTGWSNKIYDANIAKAASTSDQTVRFYAFKENEDILVNQYAVCAPLDYTQKSQYKGKYVKGYMSTLFGSSFECKYVYVQGRDTK